MTRHPRARASALALVLLAGAFAPTLRGQAAGGSIELVSATTVGAPAGGSFRDTGLSRVAGPAGRYVVFTSASSQLVAGDANDHDDVFLRDRQAGTTVLVSRASDGSQGNGDSRSPVVTP